MVLAALVLLGGCRPAADESDQPPVANNAATERPPLQIAQPSLDRAALLEAAARAASSAALGQDDREAQRALDSGQFEVRVRFGCPNAARSAAGAAGPFRVRFEEDSRTLRLTAAPDLTLEEKWIAERAGEGVEAVEGFWMYRPWLLAPGCPALAAPPRQKTAVPAGEQAAAPAAQQAAEPATPVSPPRSDHRVGIAQFFTEADPRTGRRDSRAYEATVTLPEGQQPSAQGYDLVLSGRLRKFPDGRVIACHVAGLDSPPECVIAAEFDRVRIERPGARELLAEWGGG